MDKEERTAVITKYARHEGDSGSPEVQVALLTGKIAGLTNHMVSNRHDFHTQHGLIKMVGKRRRLLAYLMKEDVERYRNLIKSLGLRK